MTSALTAPGNVVIILEDGGALGEGGGGGGGGGGDMINSSTMEDFGAVGNGSTSDQVAATTATAALNAGTIKQLFGSANKNYRVSTDGGGIAAFSLTSAGNRIAGQGDSTVFSTVTNGLVFKVAAPFVSGDGQVEHTTIQDLRIVGNSSGGPSANSQDGVEVGYLGGDGAARFRAINVTCESMGGRGFVAAFSPEIIGTTWVNCKAWLCVDGFYAGHEVTFVACQANKCTGRGLVVGSGNVQFTGCEIIQCAVGVDVIAGGNDGHGMLCGGNFNHNTIAVRTGALVNGFSFVGCNFYQGDHLHTSTPGAGKPSEIKYVGCTIDGTTFLADGANVVFEDCKFDVAYFSSMTETNGGSFRFINPTMVHGGPLPDWIGTRVHERVSYASNADKILTRAQSYRNYLEVTTGSETTTVNMISQRSPAQGETFNLINHCAHTVNYYWGDGAGASSGAGLVVPTNVSVLIGADGTDAVDMGHMSNNLSAAPPIGGVDPTSLNLTALWRGASGGEYDGAPWSGTASAGASGGRNLTDPGSAALTVGSAQNGITPGDSDGTKYLRDVVEITTDFISLNAYRVVLLVKMASASAPAGNVYDNPGLLTENQGNWGIVFDTSGVTLYHHDGSYKTITASLATGAYHLIDIAYDGTNLNLSVDGSAATPVAAGSLTDPGGSSTIRVMRNFSTVGSVGSLMEVWMAQSALSSTTPSAVKSYINSRYALSL